MLKKKEKKKERTWGMKCVDCKQELVLRLPEVQILN